MGSKMSGQSILVGILCIALVLVSGEASIRRDEIGLVYCSEPGEGQCPDITLCTQFCLSRNLHGVDNELELGKESRMKNQASSCMERVLRWFLDAILMCFFINQRYMARISQDKEILVTYMAPSSLEIVPSTGMSSSPFSHLMLSSSPLDLKLSQDSSLWESKMVTSPS
ncbi:unnamed protein product [Sphenostylis stenocarpa]|uniref:Uncharacterized protein n=1 Tax=Sphenostylis stenocarpa TaxID=92480 RepID=A0AA86VMN5_9FABA|nr:unnamed protein product [Sphenostylis stenocarpa]